MEEARKSKEESEKKVLADKEVKTMGTSGDAHPLLLQ